MIARHGFRHYLWVALALLVPAAGQATPIRYTLTGVSTGSLGGVAYSSAPFTIVLEEDSDNIATYTDGVSTLGFFGPGATDPPSTGTIQFDGFPLATFTVWVEVFIQQSYAPYGGTDRLVSFGRPSSIGSAYYPGWAGMFAADLAGVSLASEFSAVALNASGCWTVGAKTIPTDQGNLVTADCASRLTSIQAQYVPAPAVGWLPGVIIAVLGARRRFRRSP